MIINGINQNINSNIGTINESFNSKLYSFNPNISTTGIQIKKPMNQIDAITNDGCDNINSVEYVDGHLTALKRE